MTPAPTPAVEYHIVASPASTPERLADLDGKRIEVVETLPGESIDEALHRRLASAAARGAIAGGVVVGLVTALLTTLLSGGAATAAGLGLAMALTGGAFLGSLTGFAQALHLAEGARASIGPEANRRDARLIISRPRRRP